jgi:molybdopterin/thiamine biosynthesis adenylyltransferase
MLNAPCNIQTYAKALVYVEDMNIIIYYFRLWGDQGQQDLETAHVCLINATALGTEILKSLVLPGIGAFTIIDNEIITEEDVGSK